MNIFLKSPEERQRAWKVLRKEIHNLSELEQIKKVCEFWAQAPLVKFQFDWTQPSTWLTPWEMMYEGTFCRNGLAYMIEQTLILSDETVWKPERFKLVMLKDIKIEDQMFVTIIDDIYVLNYEHNNVTMLDDIKDHCIYSEKYIPEKEYHKAI